MRWVTLTNILLIGIYLIIYKKKNHDFTFITVWTVVKYNTKESLKYVLYLCLEFDVFPERD